MNMFKSPLVFLFLLFVSSASAELADVVQKIKPSVVGVGLYTPTGRPQNQIRGSGFVVADGLHIVTNNHVLPEFLDPELLQELVVYVGSGKAAKVRKATIVARDEYHDLAIIKISGKKLPVFKLASKKFQREGSYVAFTGFPIGSVLGIYPVTHRGIIASITPVVIPAVNTQKITPKMLSQMRNPYMVYQLDATAYPGNSGSAMYDLKTGEVLGVINKVFIQKSKEAIFSNPSGITYAIPVKHVYDLMEENNL